MIIQAIPFGEPILIGACVTGAGGITIWFAQKVIVTADKVDRICQALWGAPEGSGSDGLMTLMHEQRRAMGVLSNENVEIRERMRDVERTCTVRHGVDP